MMVKILKGITIGLLVFLVFLIVLISCIPEQDKEKAVYQSQKVVPTKALPPPQPQYIPPPVEDEDVYYSSCKEAKAAGAAPLILGEPGYRIGLDADGDGRACER